MSLVRPGHYPTTRLATLALNIPSSKYTMDGGGRLRECESCGRTSDCVTTKRDFYDGWYLVCCTCMRFNSYFWRFGNNEAKPCDGDLHRLQLKRDRDR